MPLASGQNSEYGAPEYKKLQGTTRTYPIGIDSIPYASYFKITKYKYQAGLEAAGKDKRQNGVLGAIGRNQTAMGLSKSLNSIATGIFNGGNSLNRAGGDILLEQAIQQSLGDTPDPRFDGQVGTMGDALGSYIPPAANDYSNIKFPITTADGRTFENQAQLTEYKKKAKLAADTQSSICKLPLPNEFQYSYDASWSNEFKLGTMARLLEDGAGAFQQALTTGTMGAVANALGQGAGGALDKLGAGLTAGAGINVDLKGFLSAAGNAAVNPFGVNSSLTPTNLIGLGGLAPNENAMMMFSKMQMRSFDVTFELFARDDTEAKEINAIIQWFKVGMHPYATPQGVGGVLGFPDVFVLEPEFIPADETTGKAKRAITHPMMPKTKLCALSRMTVNTTPANSFLTTYTGDIPLQQITLTFNELTALTQADMEVGNF
jgi:hypothetical protein